MIVFIAYYELGLLVNRHTGSLIKQYCFDGAKVLLFHDVHKYPKLAFFSSTYCGNLPTPQAQKQNNPHTMRDKEHRYDTRRRQIFLFPPLILRSETEQEKKHRATMQNWRHLEGGEASVKRYLMTDADKERSPKDESQRFSK